jgi:hypothetical protein
MNRTRSSPSHGDTTKDKQNHIFELLTPHLFVSCSYWQTWQTRQTQTIRTHPIYRFTERTLKYLKFVCAKHRMISASWIVLLLIGAVHALGNVVDPKFRTVCSLLYSRAPHGDATSHECYVSLFTYRNISFHDAIVYVSDDLCGKELVLDEYLRTALLTRHIGLAAGRGGCSFSTKAQNAEALGFELLLIINTDDQTFPVGPAEIDVPLTIPVLMAGSGMAKDLLLKDASTTGEAVEAVITGVAGAQFEDNTSALVDALVQLHVEFGNSCELKVACRAYMNLTRSSRIQLQ